MAIAGWLHSRKVCGACGFTLTARVRALHLDCPTFLPFSSLVVPLMVGGHLLELGSHLHNICCGKFMSLKPDTVTHRGTNRCCGDPQMHKAQLPGVGGHEWESTVDSSCRCFRLRSF